MALEDQVNQWFTDNPNSTPQQVADAVKAAGGLDANAGLADILGARFGIGAGEVTEAYGRLTSPSTGGIATLASSAPPSNYVSNVGNTASTPTSQATAPTGLATLQNASNNVYGTSIEDLYKSVLGRAPDAGGLQYWKDTFGDTIDPTEIATFKTAAAPEISTRAATDAWFAANPDADVTTVADAVTSAGGLSPQLSSILAQRYGTDEATIKAVYEQELAKKAAAAQDTSYTDLVTSAYGDIGRTGIGTTTSNIDQGGLDYWKGQLASGAISQDDFKNVFNNAVREYKAANPDDPYTKYVTEYQLGKQADPMKTGIAKLLADNKITLEEANEIQAYQDNYGFDAAGISRVTGQPIEVVNQILGARGNILSQGYAEYSSNALDLADYAVNNKLNAKDLSTASGGALTEEQAQGLITKAGSLGGRLELSNPEAYNQINGIINRAVHRDNGGVRSDWMYEMFTGLSPTETSTVLKQLEFAAPTTKKSTGYDEFGNNTYEYDVPVPAKPKDGQGVEAIWSSETWGDGTYAPAEITGYRAKVDSDVFKPDPYNALYATYDATGKLTGYESNRNIYTSDRTYYGAKWNADGKAEPYFVNKGRSGLGGFLDDTIGGFKEMVGPEIWTVLKIFPPTAPYANGADAVLAASNNDWEGAVINATASYASYQGNVATDTGVAGGMGPPTATQAATMSTAATNAANANLALATVGAVDAAENGNYTPLLNVAAGVSGLANNPTVATAFNTMGAVNAAANNDMTGLFNSAGNLTGSKDLKLAAAANNFREAYESGDSTRIITAAAGLSSAAQNNARTSGAVQTVKDFVNGSIQSVKGQSIDIINDLKNSGLTETKTDLNTITEPDASKYTMLDEEDLTQGTQVAGPGGAEPGKFAPGTYTKTATGMFANVEMPDGSTKSVPVLVRPDGSLAPTSGSADDAEAVKVLRVDPTKVDRRFFDNTQINVPKTPAEIDALSTVTGKSTGDVSDATVKYEVPKDQTPANMLKYVRGAGFDENFNNYALAHTNDPQYIQQLATELEDAIDDPNLNAEYKRLTGSYYPGSKLYNETAPLTPVPQGKDFVNPWGPVANVTVDGITEDAGKVTDSYVESSTGSKITTQFDAKTNVETTTKVDPKTGTSIQIITTPDLSTQVVTNPATNTQTKTVTDLSTNVSTTVKIDLKTGSVTVVPPTEPPVVTPPPVVPPPVIPDTPVTPTPDTPVTPTSPTTPVTPTTPTKPTTTAAQSTGLNFGQVQQALAAAGIPQLANVFYYGKDFGGKKQKLDKRGELIDEEYDPLSVTKAGAAGELEEQIAEEAKTKENDVNTALDHILGKSSESTSLDDLLNIVKGA